MQGSASDATRVGTLHVAIRDQKTGVAVPAMTCITSVPDNTWRAPPDRRAPAGFVTNQDMIVGRMQGTEYVAGSQRKWFPGDVGPAVLMAGDFPEDPEDASRPYIHQKRKRNLWYYGKRAIPWWKEPAAYFVSRPFTIKLPPGRWRLAVMRGTEYVPVAEELTLGAGQTLTRTVELERWVNMPRLGWYSGDAHVHSPRVDPLQDEYIMTWAQAMDVHMTCVLSYANQRSIEGCPQARYGKESRFQRGDYWLESGLEDPREPINQQGHATQINIQKIVRDPNRYQLYDFVADGVHAQGGLFGYTHLAWSPEFFRRGDSEAHPGWDASINIVRGKIDFIDILESASLGVEDFYDFLNLGIKLTAMASSDNPAAVVGEERAYAYTGPDQFTVDTWYEAVKQGRTFVTNGPMLLLTVDGEIPGGEFNVERNTTVSIRAHTWAPEAIGRPKILEVVSHGQVIHSVEPQCPRQEKLEAELEWPVAHSQWIAARTTSFSGAVAHTSPVYAVVNGESFVNRAVAAHVVAKRLKALEYIENRVQKPEFTKHYAAGVVDELLKRVEDARAKYVALAQASER